MSTGSLPVLLLRLAAWFYLALLGSLLAWVGVGVVARGWEPVVVSSGEAVDHLHYGDVVLIERASLDAGDGSVAAIDRGGRRLVRRVHSLGGTGLTVTIDGQPSTGGTTITDDELVGLGRLVVPRVGLPVVWLDGGQLLPFLVWLTATLAAMGYAAARLLRRALRRRIAGSPGALHPFADIGARRVRNVVALLVAVHFLLQPDRFDLLGNPRYRFWVVAISVSILLVTSLVSSRVPSRTAGYRVAELAIDTLVVVALGALTGTSGLGWVLWALPVIEAAITFGLVGAVANWMALTAFTLLARAAIVPVAQSGQLLDELAGMVSQASLLLVVLVPGAYLAEQLLAELAGRQRAGDEARRRGALLETVAQAGHALSHLGDLPAQAIVENTARLGFDAVDIVQSSNGADWIELASTGDRPLPSPGTPGSGLRREDLALRAALVDAQDPDPEERLALVDHGFDTLVAQRVSKRIGRTVVLRAAVTSEQTINPDQIETFQLLAGEAATALQNQDLLSELQVIRDDLQHQADHDALTGLANRALLLKEVAAELAAPGCRPALLFCDLNGFKPINDRLGHELGDALLKMVSRRLENLGSEQCLVARLGGDEFTLLVRGSISDVEAGDIARQLERRVREPFELRGDLIHISTSIGIAFGLSGMEPAELIRRADVAMYEAKADDRADRTHFVYRPAFDRERTRRSALATAIAHAIRDSELGDGGMRLDYQSIHRLTGRRSTIGVEALLRWHHELYGEIPPEEILEVAQTAGLRRDLNQFIVDRACNQAAHWARRFPRLPFFVTINASPEEISSSDMGESLEQALELTGLDPSHLLVEISERIMSEDENLVRSKMTALCDLGVGLLLDDFGEGRSCLSHLHELPLAGIKLDRKLVANTARGESERVVLESIVELCRRLELVVIAEGIEDREHLDLISTLGCAIGQGHYLGRPIPPSDITAILDHENRRIASVLDRPLTRAEDH